MFVESHLYSLTGPVLFGVLRRTPEDKPKTRSGAQKGLRECCVTTLTAAAG